jgi:hypothetical protein
MTKKFWKEALLGLHKEVEDGPVAVSARVASQDELVRYLEAQWSSAERPMKGQPEMEDDRLRLILPAAIQLSRRKRAWRSRCGKCAG